MVIGGGEGMAESVLGEEFLAVQDDTVKKISGVAPLGKSRIPAPSVTPSRYWIISDEIRRVNLAELFVCNSGDFLNTVQNIFITSTDSRTKF